MSRIPSGSSDRNPNPTNAKEILASFHKLDTRRQVDETRQKENRSAWTSPVFSPPATEPSAENSLSAPAQSAPSVLYRDQNSSPKPRPKSAIENRSGPQADLKRPGSGQPSSSRPSPTLAEIGKHHRLNPMSYSDPALVARTGQSRSNPSSAPGSRNHSRRPSFVIPTPLSHDSSRGSILGPQTSRLNPANQIFNSRLGTNELGSGHVPYPEGSAIVDVQKRDARRWGQIPIYPSSNFSTSPPRHALPGGYTSEPLSVDMSRDPSGQSRASWQTDPPPATRRMPMAFGPQLPTSPTYTVVYAPQNSMNVQTAAYAMPVAGNRPAIDYLGSSNRFEYGGEPDARRFGGTAANQSIFFGEHEVDVDEARQRVVDWNLRQSPAVVYDPRTGQPFLAQAPRMQVQRSDPGTAIIPVPMAVPIPIALNAAPSALFSGRTRSGSTPDPVYPGMGLGIGLGIDPQHSSPRNH